MMDENQGPAEDEEMVDVADQANFESSKDNVSMQSIKTVKSGRPKIPPQWSRIVNMELDGENDLQAHSLSIDQQLA